MTPIRILLADDHTVVRGGLRAMLERESDMTVVAEAADGRESVRLAETEAPDALKAGAKGYLLKDSMRGEVVQAIRLLSQGRSFLTRKVARILQQDYISRLQKRGLADRYDLLSDREREVLQIIAEGVPTRKSRT